MKKIEKGSYKIGYRMPSITEGMRLLGETGLDPNNPELKGAKQIMFMADLIDNSAKFVERLEKNGKTVEWEDAINDMEFRDAATELASAILLSLGGEGDTERKKP